MPNLLSRSLANPYIKWIFAVITLSIIPILLILVARNPMEAGRLRNALVAEIGKPSDFTWLPANRPRDFLVDVGPPSSKAEEVVRETLNATELGGLDKSLALAQYLLKVGNKGTEIKSDFATALHKITLEKVGYCADFSQVMVGLLNVAGVPVRKWGFSFDGYGGHGHSFIEIFDNQYGWVFMDVFNGFYVRDRATGNPLSTLEFRDRVISDRRDFNIIKIKPGYFFFRDENMLIDYFRKGANQYFLAWGVNLFDYERQPLVKVAHKVSRSLEQLAGIATGVYPVMKIMPLPASEKEIAGVIRLKWILYGAVVGEALIAFAWLWHLLKIKNRSASAQD